MDWKIFLASPAGRRAAGGRRQTPVAVERLVIGLDRPHLQGLCHGHRQRRQFQGLRSVSVQSQEELVDPTSHGALIQYAYGYEGRRVRFSGWMRSADVKDWAGAFLRI